MAKERGFIGTLILIIIAIILVKYFFDFDVFEAADSSQGQETIGYTRSLWRLIWSYISTPAVFVWREVLWPVMTIAWDNFQNFLEWGRETAATPL